MRLFRLGARGAVSALLALIVLGSSASAGVPLAPDVRASWVVAPVALPQGTYTTVHTLGLHAGHWVVTVKLRATQTAGTLDGADCLINSSLHGPWDRSVAWLQSNPRSESMATMTLIGWLDLSIQTDVRLRCKSSSGHVEASDVRMQGIRVASIHATSLPGGTQSVTGSGQPHAEVVSREASGPLYPRTGADPGVAQVARMTVPAGDWAVFAKTQIYIDKDLIVKCVLSFDGDTDMGIMHQSLDTGERTLGMMLVHRAATTSIIALSCIGSDVSQSSAVLRTHIVALKLGTLLNGQVPYTANLPATAPPKVMAGYRDGPIDIGTNSSLADLGSLQLPAGNWSIWAKLNLGNAGGQLVECRLAVAGKTSDLANAAPENAGLPFQPPSNRANVVLQGIARLKVPSRVFVRCGKMAPQGLVDQQPQASWLKIVALKAGTLEGVEAFPL